jgi:hypothetical protein
MIKTRILKKAFSSLTVCCFLLSIQFSHALALEQQEEIMCSALDNPLFEELTRHLLSHVTYTSISSTSEEALATISVEQLDVLGFIVIYYIFMFIYYGRLCLETLDPDPCGSMVTNLVLALFLGILLEGV